MSIRNGSIFSTTLLAVFVLILLGVAFCETNKAYWDYRVKKMCEKDGGLTVYEKATLTEKQYKELGGIDGRISVSDKRFAKDNDPYFRVYQRNVVKKSFPRVYRSEYRTMRRSDNKVLALNVFYSRVGGDFPTGLAHDSSFGCPESVANEKIFLIEGMD